MGGRSLERDVSLVTGRRVSSALSELGYSIEEIDVDNHLIAKLKRMKPDIAFIALHGKGGEDGTVQELLEILEIPYTGSGVFASIVGMDKVLTKEIFRLEKITTPDFYSFSTTAFREMGAADTLPKIAKTLGYPLVIKPAGQGSALGLKMAHSEKDLSGALMTALSYDDKVVMEKFIEGRELAVSILGTEHRVLPIVEIFPKSGFYDYEARYTMGLTDYQVPAELDESVKIKVEEIAIRSYKALKCVGFGRVDIILDPNGVPNVIEINTIPGLTETSTFPMAAEAAGLDFSQMAEEIVKTASLGQP